MLLMKRIIILGQIIRSQGSPQTVIALENHLNCR